MQKTIKENFSCFGRTTLRKFSKLKIYIEGLSKIGADLTTNLVILSPHIITLHDPEIIKLQDCHNTYHYPKEQVGKKTRADHMIEMCHRLNNKVYVDKTSTQITQQGCLKYDVVIFCDVYDLGRVICIDKFIKQQKMSKTVVMYGCQMGYFGLMITDFGQDWDMYHSGEEFPKINIQNITNSQKGQVTTATPHNYQTGDFVTIHYVEGMKYVNSDARPVTVLDQKKFTIQDTRNFGIYAKGGVCQKVDLVQKLKFPSFQQQLSKKHSELMLIAKAIVCFFQNNSRLPGLFDQTNQQETMENLKVLSQKSGMKYDQTYARKVIKTADYSFYSLISLFSAILSLEVVKCTGKYKPIKTPFFVDWYKLINFQTKKKIPDQMINIIDTPTLQKLAALQVGIVDDGSQSLQLLNLLYSCSIAEKNRVVLCGLQSINQAQTDGLSLKARLKYQVSNQLFKNKKTQTMPCSLSFSNDLLLSDMWKKIKLLINTSSKLNQYVYNNVIWNQIDILDSNINDLQGILKMSASNKSQLKQNSSNSSSLVNQTVPDYRTCVQRSLDQFNLVFIQIFEDVRCFFNVGGSYIDKVKMQEKRRNIFLFIICCLEDGAYMDPQNIVKICRYIYCIFTGNNVSDASSIDTKDMLIMDYLKSLYYLIAWFFTKKQPKIQQITNQFIVHLTKPIQEMLLTQKDKYDIAYTKLAMGNIVTIPYLSLNDLYKKENTVRFIWNASQIHAKNAKIDQEVSSKKFYKHYFRKLKPCPFITQIINSLIPISVLQNVYGTLKNCEVDMIQGKISLIQCPPPVPFKSQNGIVLVPQNCNEWTVIVIQGPKKINQIIQRFNYIQNVIITKIRCQNHDLYDKESKKNIYMDFNVQSIPMVCQKQKKDAYQLHIQAVDRDGRKCEVSRVKYIVQQKIK